MTIKFRDDKKEKWQSVSAEPADINFEIHTLYCDELIGYGKNKQEAKQSLLEATKKRIEQYKNVVAKLQEMVDTHESNRNVGSPCDG
jgi:hypothetical protein